MRYFGIVKKVSLVSAGNILNAGFGLVFLAASARALSPADFGKYALLTTLLVFMSKIVDFGSNSVFVAESLKITGKADLIKTFFVLKVMLFSVAVLFFLLTYYVLGYRSLVLLAIFLMGLVFYAVNVTLFAFFQSAELFTHAVLLNSIPAFVKAGVGVLMLLGMANFSLIAVSATFCLSMGLCVFMYFFIPQEFKLAAGAGVVAKANFIQSIRASFPAGVSQLVSQGWSTLSNTLVKVSNGFSDVGVFYLADKLAGVFSLISLSIFTVVLPQNARRKKEHLPHDLKETGILALLILILAVGFVSVSGVFVQTLFSAKYAGSLLILDILIVASAVSAIHAFMENYFYIHNSTKTIMYISLAKLVLFVFLALLLLPILSLKGLALAQLISAVVGLLLVGFCTVRFSVR